MKVRGAEGCCEFCISPQLLLSVVLDGSEPLWLAFDCLESKSTLEVQPNTHIETCTSFFYVFETREFSVFISSLFLCSEKIIIQKMK